MKIAIGGKGGVGKTTLVALLATAFRDSGKKVIVADADPDPNLAGALGFKEASDIVPVAEIDKEILAFVAKILLGLVLALLLLSGLTLVGLQKFVIKPLSKLNAGTDLIKRTGNLEYQIEIQSTDEIGQLGFHVPDARQEIPDDGEQHHADAAHRDEQSDSPAWPGAEQPAQAVGEGTVAFEHRAEDPICQGPGQQDRQRGDSL